MYFIFYTFLLMCTTFLLHLYFYFLIMCMKTKRLFRGACMLTTKDLESINSSIQSLSLKEKGRTLAAAQSAAGRMKRGSLGTCQPMTVRGQRSTLIPLRSPSSEAHWRKHLDCPHTRAHTKYLLHSLS